MYGLVRTVAKLSKCSAQQRRTFLSQAYYCKEVWDQRFQDPVIQKVALDELYNELDQKYSKYKNISAIDVDVFANAITDESYTDELLDVIHKLRLSADTSNTLNSTLHAVIRNLTDFGKTNELLMVLDDRFNYGIFLDHFSANLLLDTFWKNKDYTSGARVASQLMLQEDFGHPLCSALSLLHCYNYLQSPTEWPQAPKPEEPEDEVKVRVNLIRNPYDDRHFDLRDQKRIIGKTIMMITSKRVDTLEKSLYLLGVCLFEGPDAVETHIASTRTDEIYEDVLKLFPEGANIKQLKVLQADVQTLLQDRVKAALDKSSEKDIAQQCSTYLQWEKERHAALAKQHERLLRAKRIADVKQLQTKLKEKETLLWYFENEEKIELQIEEKDALLAEIKPETNVPITHEAETYVPPEVQKKYAKNK